MATLDWIMATVGIVSTILAIHMIVNGHITTNPEGRGQDEGNRREMVFKEVS